MKDIIIINSLGELRNIITSCDRKENLNHLDISNLRSLNSLFLHTQFNGDISKWDTSNIIDFEKTFKNSEFKGDISNWNVSSGKYFDNCFSYSKFNGDLSRWDLSNSLEIDDMFYNSLWDGKNGGFKHWEFGKLTGAYQFLRGKDTILWYLLVNTLYKQNTKVIQDIVSSNTLILNKLQNYYEVYKGPVVTRSPVYQGRKGMKRKNIPSGIKEVSLKKQLVLYVNHSKPVRDHLGIFNSFTDT